MKNEDIELIQRTLAGDDGAFSALVEKYRKQVHALAWRKIGDFHIAEDITQDTFLKAYQRLHTLKEPHRFAGWLYVIATRRCLAWFRKKRLQTQVLENIDTSTTNKDAYSRHIAEEQAKTIDKEQQEVVKKLLETLKESDRTVITLHYFGEMTCEQMSEFLGVSANTIKSRLRRARNRLKKEEPMIREAISNFQISPNLTENIMREIARLKPATPSVSKPLIPWVIGAAGVVLLVLMLGIGSQYLARFQRPYSLDAQAEMEVELIDAAVVQDVEVKPDVRNQLGKPSDTNGRDDGNGEESNQTLGDEGDYTRWNLPEGAKRRLGKGILNDMQLSPDGTRLAIAGAVGIWLYDVSAGNEISFITDHKHEVDNPIPQIIFSPDGKTFASKGHRRTIWLWDADTGKHLRTIKVPNAPATGYQFFKDGTLETIVIPLSQSNPDDDNATLYGFAPNNKRTKASYIVPAGPLRSFKFLADSKTLVTQNLDGTVWFWDITTGEQTAKFRPKLPKLKLGSFVEWVNFSPDKWRIATDVYINPAGEVIFAVAGGDRLGTIYIQDGRTGKLIRTYMERSTPENRIDDVGQMDDRNNLPLQNRVRLPNQKNIFAGKISLKYLEWITSLHFAPDGKTLVSKSQYRNSGRSSFGGAVGLWDVDTGKLLTKLTAGIDIKFSKDGKTLAIMGNVQKNCAIWDIAARREIALFPGEVEVKFSDDGKTFTILGNDSFEIWDITTRSQTKVLNTVPGQFALLPERHAFSGDGKILAAVDRYGTVNLWETQTGTQLRPLTTSYTTPITTLAFSHDGKTLAGGDGAGNIQLWDFNTGTVSTTLTSHLNKYIGGLAFATDNTKLISESEGNIEEWDVATGRVVNAYTIRGADRNVHGAGSLGMASSDGTFFSWSSGVTILTPNGGKLGGLLYSSRSRNGREDGSKIAVWDIATGKHLCTVKDKALTSTVLAFTSDENTFATLGRSITYTLDKHAGEQVTTLEKNIVYLWDTYSGEQLALIDVLKDPVEINRRSDIFAGVFTHDGKTLAFGGSSGNYSIFIWNIATQKHIATLSGHGHIICQLAFSPDDTILASGDADGEIRLWEMPSGENITTFESPGGHVSKLVFAPDGKTFASTNGHAYRASSDTKQGGIIFLWDVPSK